MVSKNNTDKHTDWPLSKKLEGNSSNTIGTAINPLKYNFRKVFFKNYKVSSYLPPFGPKSPVAILIKSINDQIPHAPKVNNWTTPCQVYPK